MSLIKIGQALALSLLTLPFLSQTGKALSGSMYGQYSKAFAPSDPVVVLGLGLSQKMNRSYSLYLSQEMTKNLVIDSSKEELEFQDTRIGVRLYPKSLIENVEWTVKLSATLPTSKASRANEIQSKPEVFVGLAYNPIEWLSIDGSAYGRYYLSKFETAPADGETGGDALPKYSLGVNQGASIYNETFTLGYQYGYREVTYYKVEQTSQNNALISDLPDQGYSIGLYLSANVWQGGSVTLSFDQGSALIQRGWEDYVLYDKEESSWSVMLMQNF